MTIDIAAIAPDITVPGRFDGQVVLVTGAAGGMGFACATRAAREGGAVVLCDIDGAAAMEAAAGISANGGRALGIAADITSRDDCNRMVAAAVETFGSLDVATMPASWTGAEKGRPHRSTWRALPICAAPSTLTSWVRCWLVLLNYRRWWPKGRAA